MRHTERHLDAIKELINIGVGRAATSLNNLMSSHIRLAVPTVKIYSNKELAASDILGMPDEVHSSVQLRFDGKFSGFASLLFPKASAARLVSTLMADTQTDLDMDSMKSGILNEVGNIVLNGVMGSISNLLDELFNYSLPQYSEAKIRQIVEAGASDDGGEVVYLLAHMSFLVEKQNVDGMVFIVFELSSFEALIEKVEKLITQGGA